MDAEVKSNQSMTGEITFVPATSSDPSFGLNGVSAAFVMLLACMAAVVRASPVSAQPVPAAADDARQVEIGAPAAFVGKAGKTGEDGEGFSLGFIRFAAIGGWGGSAAGSKDAARLCGRVRGWAPDFIVALGGGGRVDTAAGLDGMVGPCWSGYIHPYHGSYGKGAAHNRFFPALGSADWSRRGASEYLGYFELPGKERYYDVLRGPVHLFALDSDPREPDGVHREGRQAAWLRKALAASAAPWKIVYFHSPPYSSAGASADTAMRWPFREWGVDAVIAGREGHYERLLVGGLPYFVNGLGCGARREIREPIPASQSAFAEDNSAMLVEADARRMDFRFVTVDGLVVDAFTLRKIALTDSRAFPAAAAAKAIPAAAKIPSAP